MSRRKQQLHNESHCPVWKEWSVFFMVRCSVAFLAKECNTDHICSPTHLPLSSFWLCPIWKDLNSHIGHKTEIKSFNSKNHWKGIALMCLVTWPRDGSAMPKIDQLLILTQFSDSGYVIYITAQKTCNMNTKTSDDATDQDRNLIPSWVRKNC